MGPLIGPSALFQAILKDPVIYRAICEEFFAHSMLLRFFPLALVLVLHVINISIDPVTIHLVIGPVAYVPVSVLKSEGANSIFDAFTPFTSDCEIRISPLITINHYLDSINRQDRAEVFYHHSMLGYSILLL